MTREGKIGPSRWWHAVAALVFAAGAIGVPVGLVFGMLSMFAGGEQFLGPGAHTVSVAEPGRWVISYDAETFFKGRQYSSSSSLPAGTRMRVVQDETGALLPTEAVGMGGSETSGNTKRYSICAFEAPMVGTYTIQVDALPDDRVFSVRKSPGVQAPLLFLLLFLVAGPLCLAGWLIPPVLILIVELMRYRNRGLGERRVPAGTGR